jgi:hypothetical protein
LFGHFSQQLAIWKGVHVAQQKSRGFVFETLESRCLLNGSVFSSVPIAERPQDNVSAPIQIHEVEQPAQILADGPFTERFETYQPTKVPLVAAVPKAVESYTVGRPVEATVQTPISTIVSLIEREQIEIITVVFENSTTNEPAAVSDAAPTHSSYEANSEYMPPAVVKVTNAPAAPISQPPQNVVQVPITRDSGNAIIPSRDAGVQPVTPLATKLDAPIAGPLYSAKATLPTLPTGIASDVWRDHAEALLTTERPVMPTFEIQRPSARAAAPAPVSELARNALDQTFEQEPSTNNVLTNILPADFSGLDHAVNDFFRQVDKLGVKLTSQHMSLLYATGLMAGAATAALEIGRRRMKTPVPVVALQRPDSLPYSD